MSSPRRMLPVIVIISGLGVMSFSIVAPALPDLAADLGVSRGAIGLVQGAVAMPGIVLAVVIGYLADRYGRRQVILASLIIFGLAGAACFFARDFWLLVGLRAVQGIGTSGLLSLGAVIIGDAFEGPERQWAIGIEFAGITGMTLVAPVLGGALAEVSSFLPFAVFALALPIIPFIRILPGKPEGTVEAPWRHLGDMVGEMKETGKLVSFAGLLPFSFIVMLCFVGFGFTTTPLFLERVFEVGPSGRGFIQASASVGSSIAAISSARVVRSLGRTPMLTAAIALSAVGFAIVGIAPGLPFVALGLFTFGLGIGSVFPVVQVFLTEAATGTYRGAAIGTWVSSIRAGQAIGPVIGTRLADSLGERETFGIGAVILSLAALVWIPTRRWAETRSRTRKGRPSGTASRW
ncbi:MAG: MFS transporter [Acidimicrobiia bacterium]|nr:MFS transporter [Acidimicrobiia bacterium]